MQRMSEFSMNNRLNEQLKSEKANITEEKKEFNKFKETDMKNDKQIRAGLDMQRQAIAQRLMDRKKRSVSKVTRDSKNRSARSCLIPRERQVERNEGNLDDKIETNELLKFMNEKKELKKTVSANEKIIIDVLTKSELPEEMQDDQLKTDQITKKVDEEVNDDLNVSLDSRTNLTPQKTFESVDKTQEKQIEEKKEKSDSFDKKNETKEIQSIVSSLTTSLEKIKDVQNDQIIQEIKSPKDEIEIPNTEGLQEKNQIEIKKIKIEKIETNNLENSPEKKLNFLQNPPKNDKKEEEIEQIEEDKDQVVNLKDYQTLPTGPSLNLNNAQKSKKKTKTRIKKSKTKSTIQTPIKLSAIIQREKKNLKTNVRRNSEVYTSNIKCPPEGPNNLNVLVFDINNFKNIGSSIKKKVLKNLPKRPKKSKKNLVSSQNEVQSHSRILFNGLVNPLNLSKSRKKSSKNIKTVAASKLKKSKKSGTKRKSSRKINNK